MITLNLKCKICHKNYSAIDTLIKQKNGANKIITVCGKTINKSTCLICRNKRAADRRIKKGPRPSSHERTPKGFIMRLYCNMKNRVNGIQKLKHHLYKNKELLSKEDFYNWALNHDDFWKLYRPWCLSKYDRKLTPSVDRIDSNFGYYIENMRWVTHSENSRYGAMKKIKNLANTK